MSRTYQTFIEGEERALELTVRDQDDAAYTPSLVYATVYNSTGTVIQAETLCDIDVNKVYFTVTDTVTATPGTYEVKWRLMSDIDEVNEYKYYHKTILTVEEL